MQNTFIIPVRYGLNPNHVVPIIVAATEIGVAVWNDRTNRHECKDPIPVSKWEEQEWFRKISPEWKILASSEPSGAEAELVRENADLKEGIKMRDARIQELEALVQGSTNAKDATSEPGELGGPPEPVPAGADLDGMTYRDLRALAKRLGVEFNGVNTKAPLVALIRQHAAKAASAEPVPQ